jgi:hypothetical protein
MNALVAALGVLVAGLARHEDLRRAVADGYLRQYRLDRTCARRGERRLD